MDYFHHLKLLHIDWSPYSPSQITCNSDHFRCSRRRMMERMVVPLSIDRYELRCNTEVQVEHTIDPCPSSHSSHPPVGSLVWVSMFSSSQLAASRARSSSRGIGSTLFSSETYLLLELKLTERPNRNHLDWTLEANKFCVTLTQNCIKWQGQP